MSEVRRVTEPVTLLNGSRKWIIGLVLLTLVVLIGTYFDTRQRLERGATLQDVTEAITAQTKEIQELQTGGTRVSFQVLQEVQKLQERGTAVARESNTRIKDLEQRLVTAGVIPPAKEK